MLTLPLCGPYAWRRACELAASPLLPLPPGHLDLADAALRLPAAGSQKSLPHKTMLALFMVLDYG